MLLSAPDDVAADYFLIILPGDALKENRYRPFRKLGQGQFASVWLALDTETNTYVAIKIGVTWTFQQQARELSLLRQLRQRSIPSHSGKRHVVELLNAFEHQEPYGKHACLVSRPLG
jgi:serine/threonine-protein kinase SRPK3